MVEHFNEHNTFSLETAQQLVSIYDEGIAYYDDEYRARNFEPRSTPQKLQERIQQGREFLVAQTSNKVLGVLEFYTDQEKDMLYLVWIITAAEHKGKGVGKELYNKFESLAQERGRARLGLGVRPENTFALTWYKKLGYQDWMLHNGTQFLFKPFS